MCLPAQLSLHAQHLIMSFSSVWGGWGGGLKCPQERNPAVYPWPGRVRYNEYLFISQLGQEMLICVLVTVRASKCTDLSVSLLKFDYKINTEEIDF